MNSIKFAFCLLLICCSSFLCEVKANALSIKEQIQKKENDFRFDENKINDVAYVKERLNHMAKVDSLLRKNMGINADDPLQELSDILDEKHSKELEKIIEKHGWITQDKFGLDACNQAWLITQHSPDLSFKHQVLFLMENLYPSGKIPAKHYAYLYDRISLSYSHLGIKQKYGTQAIWDPKTQRFELAPMQGTLQTVNQRRVKMGLPAFE